MNLKRVQSSHRWGEGKATSSQSRRGSSRRRQRLSCANAASPLFLRPGTSRFVSRNVPKPEDSLVSSVLLLESDALDRAEVNLFGAVRLDLSCCDCWVDLGGCHLVVC